MKRLRVLALCLAAALILSACSEQHITLTEDESNAIAQYSAHLIMKADKNKLYQNKLLDPNDLEKEIAARAEALSIENSRVKPGEIIPTPSPVPTPEPEQPEDVPSETEDVDNSDVEVTEPEVTEPVELSDLFDKDTFDVTYKTYSLSEEYKSDTEYFSISAPEGQKILIVSMNVKNKTDKTVKFTSTDYDVQYSVSLSVPGKNTSNVEPRISLLSNDARFMNDPIKSGDSKEIVLLFFVDKNVTHIDFKVLGDYSNDSKGKTYQINIL